VCLLIFSLLALVLVFIVMTVIEGVDWELGKWRAWKSGSWFDGERSCLRSHYISNLLGRKLITKREGCRGRKIAHWNEALTARQRLTVVLVSTVAGGGTRAPERAGSALANQRSQSRAFFAQENEAIRAYPRVEEDGIVGVERRC